MLRAGTYDNELQAATLFAMAKWKLEHDPPKNDGTMVSGASPRSAPGASPRGGSSRGGTPRGEGKSKADRQASVVGRSGIVMAQAPRGGMALGNLAWPARIMSRQEAAENEAWDQEVSSFSTTGINGDSDREYSVYFILPPPMGGLPITWATLKPRA